MKTKIISTLKKELLIIELPENGYYEEYRDGIEVRDFLTDEVLTLADYTLLGKPDEIKEEDVKDLIERVFINYKDYSGKNRAFGSPINSFNSALESEIFWDVNPFGITRPSFNDYASLIQYQGDCKDFDEAQEKTFDKKRTLIFVKNYKLWKRHLRN